MMFNYDSFAKLRIFRNKAIASRLNIVNACLEWGDLRVKAPNSRKHENNGHSCKYPWLIFVV